MLSITSFYFILWWFPTLNPGLPRTSWMAGGNDTYPHIHPSYDYMPSKSIWRCQKRTLAERTNSNSGKRLHAVSLRKRHQPHHVNHHHHHPHNSTGQEATRSVPEDQAQSLQPFLKGLTKFLQTKCLHHRQGMNKLVNSHLYNVEGLMSNILPGSRVAHF